jgi:DNA-damage-inducible protein D
MSENAKAGRKGGAVAKNARKELEARTGKSVVTGEYFLPPANEKNRFKGKKQVGMITVTNLSLTE